jgi:hypothetical protein
MNLVDKLWRCCIPIYSLSLPSPALPLHTALPCTPFPPPHFSCATGQNVKLPADTLIYFEQDLAHGKIKYFADQYWHSQVSDSPRQCRCQACRPATVSPIIQSTTTSKTPRSTRLFVSGWQISPLHLPYHVIPKALSRLISAHNPIGLGDFIHVATSKDTGKSNANQHMASACSTATDCRLLQLLAFAGVRSTAR